MKNILLFCLLSFSSVALANCYTGAACSIETLQLKQNINLINSYFDRKVAVPDYLKKKPQITNYRDLFIFNTIV